MEMADNPIIDKRYLEIAIVSVSAVNRLLFAKCTKFNI